ncbi:hypothetical protein [Swaminathania salitolerans]|uniref:Uncharacterized protein n=1 Tax=Swaminathania salitolerans TaxID=182838 RepID=A0A511BY44_9PROT|nr:hypothetical protein [Swaminathania salitolerans]GBQ14199.1 hypothetical protein AA21291_1756 [Swaminathania salitolerans LMG 21291]GEL02948.1 hypothetical protein SSA02_21110 [Swaminathania salitolerans]
MSNSTGSTGKEQVVQLKANASLMTFDAGLFCVFLAPDQGTQTLNGYPAVSVTQAPNMPAGIVTIRTFADDGLISSMNGSGAGAALVRVARGPAQVLVTTYQAPDSTLPAPGIQVARLSGPAQPAPAPRQEAAEAGGMPGQTAAGKDDQSGGMTEGNPAGGTRYEVAAHIQRRGDVLAHIGEWMGEPGSQNWIEGFGIAPTSQIAPEDIEYQAVLGKGWLSPWAEAGQYCGSRGMALPILGLCVRLKNGAEESHDLTLYASFTDGTSLGPVSGGTPLEAESLAPLEAFRVEITPRTGHDQETDNRNTGAGDAVGGESAAEGKTARKTAVRRKKSEA